MILLALATAPGLAIGLYVYSKDKYEKEPIHYLIKCFLFGALGVIPAIFLSMAGSKIGFEEPQRYGSVLATAGFTFLVVALSEEFCKYAVLRWYIYPKNCFNEPVDGIVYSVMISMGFATLENLVYVLGGGLGVAIIRMFLSVPAHGTFAILMGYFVGLAKFRNNAWAWCLAGLLAAILFHGAFDFFLFLHRYPLLIFGALASFLVGLVLSLKAIRIHAENSPFHPKLRIAKEKI